MTGLLSLEQISGEVVTTQSQGGGSYTFNLNGGNVFTGTDVPGQLVGNGTGTLTVTGLSGLNEVDFIGTSGEVVFGDSTGDYVDSFKVVSAKTEVNQSIKGLKSFHFGGATNLKADVTTGGAQTYTGEVTLTDSVKLTGTMIENDGIISGDGSQILSIVGDAFVNGPIGLLKDFLVSGKSTLANGVFTAEKQSYAGAVTLVGSADLDGSTVEFDSSITGDGIHNLMVWNAVFKGGISNVHELSVNNTGTFAADVSTVRGLNLQGAFSLIGPITLTGGVSLKGFVTGDDINDFTINGDVFFSAEFSHVKNLSVSGNSQILKNVSTIGTQTYSGAVELLSSVAFSGTSVKFGGTITGIVLQSGIGTDLEVTNGIFNGAISEVRNITVTGSSTLAANVSTLGIQEFSGAVTLVGPVSLTGTKVNFLGSISGDQISNLSITGDVLVAGPISHVKNYLVSGNSTLSADVTTAGTQTYTGPVNLTGPIALTGSMVENDGSITGDGSHDLRVTGDVNVKGPITGVNNYSVSGASTLASNLTTSGTQTYSGPVTLIGPITLTGSVVENDGSIMGDGTHDLTVNGDVNVKGPISGVNHYSVSGASTLAGNVTTAGNQTFTGAIRLADSITLSGLIVENEGPITGDGISSLTITGDANVNGTISGIRNYTVSGVCTLAADITTVGNQIYSGPVMISSGSRTLTGTTILNHSTIDCSGMDLSIVGNMEMFGAVKSIKTFSVSGTLTLGGSDLNETFVVNTSNGVIWTGKAFGQTLGPVSVLSQSLKILGFGGNDTLQLGVGKGSLGSQTKIIVDMGTGNDSATLSSHSPGATARSLGGGYYQYIYSGGGNAYIQIINTENVTFSPSSISGYISALYANILGRSPSDAEINSWLKVLGPNPTYKNYQRVTAGIFYSNERYVFTVKSWYKLYPNREGSPSEIQTWVANLASGQSDQTLLAKFVAGPEYIARHGTGIAYVNSLYQLILGRTPSSGEANSWITSQGNNYYGISKGIVFSGEYAAIMVKSFYNVYLGRNRQPVTGFANPKAFGGSGIQASEIASWLNSGQSVYAIQFQFLWSPEFVSSGQ